MCVQKLRDIDDPETVLCRAVLINNTFRTPGAECSRGRRAARRKRRRRRRRRERRRRAR